LHETFDRCQRVADIVGDRSGNLPDNRQMLLLLQFF